MTGADIVIQVLADEGVDTIFGYSGGAILPTYDAVFRYNDKHRREDGSAAMPLISSFGYSPTGIRSRASSAWLSVNST